MIEPIHIVITVNSPGEVAGWLKPAVVAIKALSFPTSITVFIPPCTFASGGEVGVVQAMIEVDRVYGPKEFFQFMFLRKALPGLVKSRVGVVLFLGGDLTYAMWLGKKFRYPAIAYTEGFANWVKSFECFAIPYSQMAERAIAKGVPDRKIKIIGNLMLDAIQPRMSGTIVRQKLGIGERPLLLLMPGSRPAHFEYMVPFLLQVVEYIRNIVPEIAVVFSISPFITPQYLQKLSGPLAELFDQSSEYIPGETLDNASNSTTLSVIKTKHGELIPALKGSQYDLMAAANIAISLPGTNTFELAASGVPTVVVLPLNYPERIPLEGIPGLIERIPWIGKELKRRLIAKLAEKMKYKYTAWPNLLMQDYVIPELHGFITDEAVSAEIVKILSDRELYQKMSQRLQETVGERGAANRLAELIQTVIQQKYRDLNLK